MVFDRQPIVTELEDYTPRSAEIEIAGQKIVVYEMTLFALERTAVVIQPHIGVIMAAFQSEEIAALLPRRGKGQEVPVDTQAAVKKVMEVVRSKILGVLSKAPKSALQAILCIMNADPENEAMLDLLRGATPSELMAALDKLNELNDFKEVLTRLTEILGYLKERYIPQTE